MTDKQTQTAHQPHCRAPQGFVCCCIDPDMVQEIELTPFVEDTRPYARPNGTRRVLRDAIEALHDLKDISMPGDFHVKARNLIVDMENERNRREP